MRIAVATNWVPFLRGGAEHLADALITKLRAYGHQAVLVRIPFRWDPPSKIIEQIHACRLLRLPNIDRVIGLKFPAYYIPHPDKVLWLLHQFRQVYDLWEIPEQGLPHSDDNRRIRSIIIQSDNAYLREAQRIFTNSDVTASRLREFNALNATVLYPPLLSQDHLHCGGYGDYIFAPGRINAAKRQHLLVESMRFCTSAAKLIVAGKAETEADAKRIHDAIRRYGLDHRVTFINRFISEEEKAALLAGARACAYLPYDEDSYGYVTLEAYLSKRPVITCEDAGGILMLVKSGVTGLVRPPDPRSIADSIDEVFRDDSRAKQMGESGYELVARLNINWDRVITALTA